MSALGPISPRVKFVNEDGTLTRDALMFLQGALQRIGGANGDMGHDVFASTVQDEPIEALSPVGSPDPALEPIAPPQRPVEGFAIGMVAITVANTSPADLLGYGTWVLIGQGRTLVGYASGDPDFGTAGGIGGVKTISIQDHPAHTHNVTSVVSVADHANHTHTFGATAGTAGAGANPVITSVTSPTDGVSATLTHTVTNGTATSTAPSATLTHLDSVSGTNFFKTLPPFLVVFFWQRTA